MLILYLFTEDIQSDADTFESSIKKYYETLLLQANGIQGFLLQNKGTQQLLIFNDNKLLPAQGEDYKDLSNEIAKLIPKNPVNEIIGFIANFKKDYLIFKTKNMSIKRNIGARCDQGGRGQSIKNLNLIFNSNDEIENINYIEKNLKGIGQKELCIIQELLLRFFNYIKLGNKTWFLSPTEAVILKIESPAGK